MHLSSDDIAAAEACGVSFLPASDAQVQRLAMQRKVFYRSGAPILATRGDGFFETVGTLQQLIEEGRRQQQDLTQWLQAAEPTAATAAASVLVVVEAEGGVVVVEPAPDADSAAEAVAAAPPAKRPRQRRRRLEPVGPQDVPQEASREAETEGEPTGLAEAEDRPAAVPLDASPLPEGDEASLAAAPATGSDAEERGKRWLVAGAARRGRAGKHWSTRQR